MLVSMRRTPEKSCRSSLGVGQLWIWGSRELRRWIAARREGGMTKQKS